MPMVMPATIAIARVAPGARNLVAAQINRGKTMYVTVASLETVTAGRVDTASRSRPPSQVQTRLHAARGARIQTIMKGTTTRLPERSPSHHVLQKVVSSDVVITPPASIDNVPTVALIAVAAASASNMPVTWSIRSSPAREPI